MNDCTNAEMRDQLPDLFTSARCERVRRCSRTWTGASMSGRAAVLRTSGMLVRQTPRVDVAYVVGRAAGAAAARGVHRSAHRRRVDGLARCRGDHGARGGRRIVRGRAVVARRPSAVVACAATDTGVPAVSRRRDRDASGVDRRVGQGAGGERRERLTIDAADAPPRTAAST